MESYFKVHNFLQEKYFSFMLLEDIFQAKSAEFEKQEVEVP